MSYLPSIPSHWNLTFDNLHDSVDVHEDVLLSTNDDPSTVIDSFRANTIAAVEEFGAGHKSVTNAIVYVHTPDP